MKKGTVPTLKSRRSFPGILIPGGSDAGLPIPNSTARIDMALTRGVPSFMQVVDVDPGNAG